MSWGKIPAVRPASLHHVMSEQLATEIAEKEELQTLQAEQAELDFEEQMRMALEASVKQTSAADASAESQPSPSEAKESQASLPVPTLADSSIPASSSSSRSFSSPRKAQPQTSQSSASDPFRPPSSADPSPAKVPTSASTKSGVLSAAEQESRDLAFAMQLAEMDRSANDEFERQQQRANMCSGGYHKGRVVRREQEYFVDESTSAGDTNDYVPGESTSVDPETPRGDGPYEQWEDEVYERLEKTGAFISKHNDEISKARSAQKLQDEFGAGDMKGLQVPQRTMNDLKMSLAKMKLSKA